MSASDLATKEGSHGHQRMMVGIIVGSTVAVISGMLLVFYFVFKRRKNFTENKKLAGNINHINEEQNEDLELPLLELSRVASATDNFSIKNKLGEGGFGPVYKGILDDGQEIAVKKLSNSSGQGLNELKNEVILIAKLQHRNLVKLLGCCIEDEEKLLIYEYMPNKSLDYFIFDETRRKLLDWSKRFNIIIGIARV
ncbi:hypothetical protein L6164_018538 [Bauhinia variegata]|uniref:Uncharacterized protein n=1 Tax=Bauhinia variegata TaxID=167791 RepID=A0ACB9NC93_BAUVA|nr:hypothetical protein L6164_018538 [Bauhinia variegata]